MNAYKNNNDFGNDDEYTSRGYDMAQHELEEGEETDGDIDEFEPEEWI